MLKKTTLLILALLPISSFAKMADEGLIIEAYGGSSTAGVLAVKKDGRLRNVVSKDNEISYLRSALREKYGDSISVINKGAPSAQAIELLNGTYKYKKNEPWETEMEKSKAKIVILNFATNDARHYHFKDAKPEYIESPEKYAQVMEKLINIARENGKEVVLQEPHPLCGRAEKWNVAPYNAQLEQVAKSLSVPLVKQYERIQSMPDWQTLMSPDCIHPSAEMYKMKSEETFKVIDAHYGELMANR